APIPDMTPARTAVAAIIAAARVPPRRVSRRVNLAPSLLLEISSGIPMTTRAGGHTGSARDRHRRVTPDHTVYVVVTTGGIVTTPLPPSCRSRSYSIMIDPPYGRDRAGRPARDRFRPAPRAMSSDRDRLPPDGRRRSRRRSHPSS